MRQIAEELESEAPSADDFDWPDPDEGFEDPLFDSTRDYVTQIDRYKEHQGKRTAAKERELKYSLRKCCVCAAFARPHGARGDARDSIANIFFVFAISIFTLVSIVTILIMQRDTRASA